MSHIWCHVLFKINLAQQLVLKNHYGIVSGHIEIARYVLSRVTISAHEMYNLSC